MTRRGLRANFVAGAKAYGRTPVLLALLIFLPIYFIGVIITVMPTMQIPISIAGVDQSTIAAVEMYGFQLVPVTCGLIGGVSGLFTMLSAQDTDTRAVVAGYSPTTILLARLCLLIPAGVIGVGSSLAMLSVKTLPTNFGWFIGASLLAALTYGVIGALVGLLGSRLGGIYAVLFLPTLDIFFFQNPMVDDPAWIAPYLPGSAVTRLALDAGLSDTVTLDPLWTALVYLAISTVVLIGAYYTTVRP